MVQMLSKYGYMAAAKAVMGMLGVEVGPARLPHNALGAAEKDRLRKELEGMGFFEWVAEK